ncbi:acyltransferase family protein [Methylobacterium variabile]|jgi:peptidoglycan/LPS O-acetylase OafA/YrhL|uniref:acyltransferase family protein n=1 Tax=Methylobacterium variabile TaxID=298794 RepID=UPI0009F98F13|nr:acyltransferase [Methylobacterium variabile]
MKIYRMQSIDGLRGVSAVAVMIFHFEAIYLMNLDHPDLFPPAPSQSLHLALLGVELFFMLSGFVILMSAEGSKSASSFLWKRSARIYPAYWASVVPAALSIFVIYGISKHELSITLINFTMFQSFFGVQNLISPYWKLAYELWFYVLMAIIIRTKRTDAMPELCMCWIVFMIAMKLMQRSGIMPINNTVNILTLHHFGFFFIIGMMTYLVVKGNRTLMVFICLIISILSTLRGRSDWAEVPPVTYFLSTVVFELVLLAAATSRLKILERPSLLWLGQQSYSLYLLHMPVGLLLWMTCHWLGVDRLMAVVLSVPVTIGLAWLSRRFIEIPGQTLLLGTSKVRVLQSVQSGQSP